ncbi:MAG: hypothetical protein M3256_12070 [Actinomycetota bacterium]|nr:hypothetical protein [Actinomycetota bacterium]
MSAGAVVVCDGCRTKLKLALDASESEGLVAFTLPPGFPAQHLMRGRPELSLRRS